jgi:cbb3-type cytochrome oxidase subunit 3
MFQHILKLVDNIAHYGVVSLCLFCLVFTGVLIWAFLQKRSHLDYMSRVALDNDSETVIDGKKAHE